MTHFTSRAILLALAALAVVPAAAWPASLKHQVTIYQDDKETPLRAPEGVACSEKGAVVVADTGNGRLLTFRYSDGKLTGGVPIRLPELPYPVRVQIGAKGDVLVLDRRTRKIVKVDAAGKFAGAVEWRNVVGATAVHPIAFQLDAADNLYVIDASTRRILVAEPSGKVTREIPLPRGPEEFTDVAVDETGRIFAVDAVGSRIWVAEKGAKELSPVGESMKDRVSFPVYVADDRSRLYLVDQHGSGLAAVGKDGKFLGRELEMGQGEGKVYYPGQICVTPEGLVFVADRGNNRVQGFSTGR